MITSFPDAAKGRRSAFSMLKAEPCDDISVSHPLHVILSLSVNGRNLQFRLIRVNWQFPVLLSVKPAPKLGKLGSGSVEI